MNRIEGPHQGQNPNRLDPQPALAGDSSISPNTQQKKSFFEKFNVLTAFRDGAKRQHLPEAAGGRKDEEKAPVDRTPQRGRNRMWSAIVDHPGRSIATTTGLAGLVAGGAIAVNVARDGGPDTPPTEPNGGHTQTVTPEPSTPPAGVTVTETPTATPIPTETEIPLVDEQFMPEAIEQINVDGDTVALDPEYPDRTECPDPESLFPDRDPKVSCEGIGSIAFNPDIPGMTIEQEKEAFKQFNNEVRAVAWARISEGKTIEEVIANYDQIVSEYNAKVANGEDVSTTVYAFSSKDHYEAKTAITINADTKLRWLPVAQPSKYTDFQLTPANKYGLMYNEATNELTVPMYAHNAGGVNNFSEVQANPSQYQLTSLLVWGGIFVGDKPLQTNLKFSGEQNRLDLVPTMRNKVIPIQTSSLWQGIIIALP